MCARTRAQSKPLARRLRGTRARHRAAVRHTALAVAARCRRSEPSRWRHWSPGAPRGVLRRLGGYTGDCLGAAQQASELACYFGILRHGTSSDPPPQAGRGPWHLLRPDRSAAARATAPTGCRPEAPAAARFRPLRQPAAARRLLAEALGAPSIEGGCRKSTSANGKAAASKRSATQSTPGPKTRWDFVRRGESPREMAAR